MFQNPHDFAPLFDLKRITIDLIGTKQKQRHLCGLWKLNNHLLNDDTLCNSVKLTVTQIFSDIKMNHRHKWEYFKFKVREVPIRRSNGIKNNNAAKGISIIDDINTLMKKRQSIRG